MSIFSKVILRLPWDIWFLVKSEIDPEYIKCKQEEDTQWSETECYKSIYQASVQFIIGITVRSALIINAFRWFSICIDKYRYSLNPERTSVLMIIFYAFMYILIVVNGSLYVINTYSFSPLYELSKIWSVYIFNSLICVFYIVIYLLMRINLKGYLKEADVIKNEEIRQIKQKAVQDALSSLLLYFIGMIQYNIVRLVNAALREKEDPLPRAITLVLYYTSEIIMLIFFSY